MIDRLGRLSVKVQGTRGQPWVSSLAGHEQLAAKDSPGVERGRVDPRPVRAADLDRLAERSQAPCDPEQRGQVRSHRRDDDFSGRQDAGRQGTGCRGRGPFGLEGAPAQGDPDGEAAGQEGAGTGGGRRRSVLRSARARLGPFRGDAQPADQVGRASAENWRPDRKALCEED